MAEDIRYPTSLEPQEVFETIEGNLPYVFERMGTSRRQLQAVEVVVFEKTQTNGGQGLVRTIANNGVTRAVSGIFTEAAAGTTNSPTMKGIFVDSPTTWVPDRVASSEVAAQGLKARKLIQVNSKRPE